MKNLIHMPSWLCKELHTELPLRKVPQHKHEISVNAEQNQISKKQQHAKYHIIVFRNKCNAKEKQL